MHTPNWSQLLAHRNIHSPTNPFTHPLIHLLFHSVIYSSLVIYMTYFQVFGREDKIPRRQMDTEWRGFPEYQERRHEDAVY